MFSILKYDKYFVPLKQFSLSFFKFLEIEAIEACKWLRAAGFPQYAQMYEGE